MQGANIDLLIKSAFRDNECKKFVLLCENVTAVEGTKSYVIVRPQKWLK